MLSSSSLSFCLRVRSGSARFVSDDHQHGQQQQQQERKERKRESCINYSALCCFVQTGSLWARDELWKPDRDPRESGWRAELETGETGPKRCVRENIHTEGWKRDVCTFKDLLFFTFNFVRSGSGQVELEIAGSVSTKPDRNRTADDLEAALRFSQCQSKSKNIKEGKKKETASSSSSCSAHL